MFQNRNITHHAALRSINNPMKMLLEMLIGGTGLTGDLVWFFNLQLQVKKKFLGETLQNRSLLSF